MRLRWVSVGLAAAAALGVAEPARAGGSSVRTRTVSHHAQAVFVDGSCIVGVHVTETAQRMLGTGKPVGAPAATMRVDTFCPDGMGSASTTLGAADYAFASDSARVDATAGDWTVHLAWQATADPQTFVVRDAGSHTVVQNAPVAVTGSVGDIGPDALLMADLATVRSRAQT